MNLLKRDPRPLEEFIAVIAAKGGGRKPMLAKDGTDDVWKSPGAISAACIPTVP
jgi:hypothetical protein